MRLLILTICCLCFSGVLHAQVNPTDAAGPAGRLTTRFSVLAYNGPGAAASNPGRLSPGSPAARPTATQAENQFDQDVTRQMRAFDSQFSSHGLSRSGAIVRGGLAGGAQSQYSYQLTAGQAYGFAGVCDRDCSDLDLLLLNSAGEVVKRDVLVDDKPIIIFRPTRSGQYRLQVRMAACSQSPCRFGFAAYVPTGESSYDAMVTRQMEAFDTAFSTQGLSRSGAITRGGLAAGTHGEYTYQLTLGGKYGFAGVCDQDCSDLDLVLLNSDGKVVGRDQLVDDKPVITYTAVRSGQYRLQVRMAACSQSPCRFGFAAYVPSTQRATGGGGGGGGGASVYDEVVTRQINVFDGEFSSHGLSRSGGIVRGGLAAGGQSEYVYNLVAGQSYGFAGVCDQDCSDLDLVLLNSAGEVVKRDVLVDDKPIIIYRPTQSGQYRLRVRMAACSQSPCRFGFAAYRPGEL